MISKGPTKAGSRDVIEGVATVIARSLAQFRCLVIFHDGSDATVNLVRCGIPSPEPFKTKVLLTFKGRLHLREEFGKMQALHTSHLVLVVTI